MAFLPRNTRANNGNGLRTLPELLAYFASCRGLCFLEHGFMDSYLPLMSASRESAEAVMAAFELHCPPEVAAREIKRRGHEVNPLAYWHHRRLELQVSARAERATRSERCEGRPSLALFGASLRSRGHILIRACFARARSSALAAFARAPRFRSRSLRIHTLTRGQMILLKGHPSVRTQRGSSSPPEISQTEEEKKTMMRVERLVLGQIISKEMEEAGRGEEPNVLCQECYVNVLAGGKRDPNCNTATIMAVDPAGGAWITENRVRASMRSEHKVMPVGGGIEGLPGGEPPEPHQYTERAC
jgi:hypothetical protein